MSILLVHEFGHFIAARIHGVPASLPFFIPLPFIGLAGTIGAIVAMRGRSARATHCSTSAHPAARRSRGGDPLIVGLSLSTVGPALTGSYMQEGQSLLYMALKQIVLGPIPEGQDVFLHPTALAGWFQRLLVTMLNLVPWGQLDGGHIAYALFGPSQNRIARWVRWGLFPSSRLQRGDYRVAGGPGRSQMPWSLAISNCVSWLAWFGVLSLIGKLAGKEHPPTERGELSPGRRVVAWFSLAVFVLLFMPTPLAQY